MINKAMKTLLQNKAITKAIAKMPTVKQMFFSIFGTILLGFLLLSLLSYNPDDPAWSHFGDYSEITNIAGRLGAWVADILHVFFGLGAWWLVFVISYELIHLWAYRLTLIWQLRMAAYVFLLIFVSAFLAQWGANSDAALSMGGVIGFELQSGLVKLMGKILTMLFLSVLLLVVATLTFGIHWQVIFYRLLSGLGLNVYKAPTQEPNQTSDTPAQQDLDTTTGFKIISHQDDDLLPQSPVADENVLTDFLKTSGIQDEILTRQQQSTINDDIKDIDDGYFAHDKHSADIVNKGNDANFVSVKEQETVQSQPLKAAQQPVQTSYPSPSVAADGQLTDDFCNDRHDESWQDDTPQNTQVSVQADLIQQNTKASLYESPVVEPKVPVVAQHDVVETAKPKSQAMDTLQYRLSLSPIPELSLLDPSPAKTTVYTEADIIQLSELLEIKLQEFNISAKVVNAIVGPVITRFEVELAAGIKVSRVTKIAQDLARSLSMVSLRVLPVIAGKPYIGIEVPNNSRQIIGLIELLNTPAYKDPDNDIAIAIGTDISGNPIIADLAKAPHMLVAGTTGSGKSVLVNSFLLSMLLKYSPDELKLVLIDPKQLELANYADIPHLLTPVITDMTEATAALTWCVNEMERRYKLMSLLKVRKLSEFNKKVEQAEQLGTPLFDPLWTPNDSVSMTTAPKLKPLPKIVVVADEFADMIMQLGKTAEEPIVRLAQKARAAGIHLILATQRPVATVVTGLIKSNVPSRVALRVNSSTDSRLIIEESGAENMLGHGDMMFLAPGKNITERAHGAYVKDDEVNRVTDAWRERGKPDYIDLSNSYTFEGEGSGDTSSSDNEDEFYQQAVAMVLETQKASASAFQRRFGIGYNRAARIMDMLEERGVVSKLDNSGKRQILI